VASQQSGQSLPSTLAPTSSLRVALSAALRVELELELEVEARSCAPVGWPACSPASSLASTGGRRPGNDELSTGANRIESVVGGGGGGGGQLSSGRWLRPASLWAPTLPAELCGSPARPAGQPQQWLPLGRPGRSARLNSLNSTQLNSGPVCLTLLTLLAPPASERAHANAVNQLRRWKPFKWMSSAGSKCSCPPASSLAKPE